WALSYSISMRYEMPKEARLVIETLAYNDKYINSLGEIWVDKVRLDGETKPEEERAMLGRDDIMKEDRNVTMINYTEGEVTGRLDAPIVVGRGFLDTIGGNIDIPNRILTTFDGLSRQTLRAARSEKSESLRAIQMIKKTIKINVWKKAISFLGSLPAKLRDVEWKPDYKLCYSDPELATGAYDHEAGSSRTKRSRHVETVEESLLLNVHHEFLEWSGCSREPKSHYNTSLETCFKNSFIYRISWIGTWVSDFNIREPIYLELCRDFYATYEFDEVCVDDELQSKKIISFRLRGRAHSLTLLEFTRRLGLYHAEELDEEGFDTYFQGDRTTLRELIDSDDRLILDILVDDVPRVATQRASRVQRASMQDLYERMGSIEIRPKAIERMKYRQAYHWDRYQGVFEHMEGVYNVSLQGDFNPPGYAQP
nr:hypothetical protein [Tanacetum cinerariifolium]